MSGDSGRGDRNLRAALLVGTGLGLLRITAVRAEDAAAGVPTARGALDEVQILGQLDAYRVGVSGLSKLTDPILDTPQSIDVISEQVLQDRAVTDLNQALHAVPGISIGAGEFKSMGNSPTIRGFVARTDMFLDGIRDYGDYFRDPFNLESIEVLEGPSSILFGRGSTGGAIEQDSKLPKLQEAIAATLAGGTADLKRATVDLNEPLPMLGEAVAARVTAMAHKSGVAGRDVVENSRWGVAPSIAFGLGTPTRLTIAYFHQYNDDIPDYGLPYFGPKPAAVARDNFYGFSSDFMHTRTDIASVKIERDVSDTVRLQNQVRYASYSRDFRFSEPLVATSIPLSTPLSSVNVTRNVNAGNSNDTMLWDQLFATARWNTGVIENATVLGLEGGREKAAPEFDNNSGVPGTSLLHPNEGQDFTAASTFPRYRTHLTANSIAPFLIETARAGKWEATLGLRWDRFAVAYRDTGYSTTIPGAVVKTDDIHHTDEMYSYRAALTYRLAPKGSLYLSFGTSFNPSAEDLSLISSSRSFSLNNAQLDPEKNKSFELGSKWELLEDRVNVSGAIFRLQKDNARVPDPSNPLANILAGSQQVDGGEIGVVGNLARNWRVTAGYTYLDGQVTQSAAGAAPVGAPLMNTPKHAFTAWSVYRIGDRIELGGGGRLVSSQFTQNAPPVKSVPGFWTLDSMAKFAFTPRIAVQLNINNLLNKYYYDQLHFFHVVPGPGRSAVLSLTTRF